MFFNLYFKEFLESDVSVSSRTSLSTEHSSNPEQEATESVCLGCRLLHLSFLSLKVVMRIKGADAKLL